MITAKKSWTRQLVGRPRQETHTWLHSESQTSLERRMLKKNEQPLGSALRSAVAAVSNRKKRKSKGRFHSGLVGKLLTKNREGKGIGS